MANVYPQTNVITVQPSNANVHPFHGFYNTWHSGLCGCCDDITQCCYAYWCWCCFVYSLAQSIDESACSCFCVPGALAAYRMKVRSVFRIRGDSCEDYCATSCCPFCVGLQMRNELKHRGIP